MLRLYPIPESEQRTVSPDDAYGQLDLQSRAGDDRPYLIVNMVSTVDGQARIDNDTSELGNETDMKLFVKLREQVDCVIAGTRTVGIEQYKGPASQQETRERRQRRGLRPRPLFATATRSGKLPINSPVFQDPDIEIVVFSEAELATESARAQIIQVKTTDPREMLAALRSQFDIRTVLLEGGPHINTPFFANELVDELFLTLAPLLTGAEGPFSIIAGSLPRRQELHLISALLDEEHLFLRYRVD
jgi:riboflavin biosynthesis pyrimidine reductase